MAKCAKCDGCGKVANSERQEPWSQWLALPLGSSSAVVVGLVRPMECPECKGKGSIVQMCQGCRFDTLDTQDQQLCAYFGIPTKVACIHKLTGKYEGLKVKT
jgi:hypothetical protein